MKVLHYVDENRLVWMAPWIQLLKELERLGVDNVVVCRNGGTLGDALRENDILFRTYTPLAQWLPPVDHGIGRIIREEKPDMIHTRLSSAARIGGYWGKKLNIPVISTFDKYPKATYYKNSDILIGCSSAVTEHIKTLDLPHARMITTVLNPVLSERYARDESVRKSFRTEKGILSGETVVLGMGRFVDWKAWDDYLSAVALIPDELPLRFWLVGDGDQEEYLRSLAHKLGVDDRVRFFPFASDVRPWLWAADMFVQPSREPEGFSLMLIEAMASGVIPIATNIGGTLDIVRDGENGYLFVPRDVPRLAELIQKAQRFVQDNTIAHNAVLSAQEISVAKIAAQTFALYSKAIAQPEEKEP